MNHRRQTLYWIEQATAPIRRKMAEVHARFTRPSFSVCTVTGRVGETIYTWTDPEQEKFFNALRKHADNIAAVIVKHSDDQCCYCPPPDPHPTIAWVQEKRRALLRRAPYPEFETYIATGQPTPWKDPYWKQ